MDDNNTKKYIESTIYIGSLYVQCPEPNVFCVTCNESDLLFNQILFDRDSDRVCDQVFIMNQPFYADSIYSLDQFIKDNSFSIPIASCMLSTLYNQYQFLSNKQYSISYVDLNDIMVINGKHFFFSNCHKLYKMTSKPNIEDNAMGNLNSKNDPNWSMYITEWYDHKNIFLSPELIHNKQLPFYCHKSSCLYSLALIVLYCLKHGNPNIDIDISKPLLDYTEIEVLNYYKNTKIFHTLSYCLNDDPVKREFILF